MNNLIGLNGLALDEPPEADQALATLKKLVAEIEEGEVHLQSVYILAEATDPTNRALVRRINRDSGMTVAEAVFRLEIEKAILMEIMLRGES
jgi:hypothetical protein